jgi:hypothetical protein
MRARFSRLAIMATAQTKGRMAESPNYVHNSPNGELEMKKVNVADPFPGGFQ